NNGLNLLGVSSFYQLVVKGIVIAVLMDHKKSRLRGEDHEKILYFSAART
ncbi:hypothetical protein, partial [Paenibacillus sp. Aloe-11]